MDGSPSPSLLSLDVFISRYKQPMGLYKPSVSHLITHLLSASFYWPQAEHSCTKSDGIIITHFIHLKEATDWAVQWVVMMKGWRPSCNMQRMWWSTRHHPFTCWTSWSLMRASLLICKAPISHDSYIWPLVSYWASRSTPLWLIHFYVLTALP